MHISGCHRRRRQGERRTSPEDDGECLYTKISASRSPERRTKRTNRLTSDVCGCTGFVFRRGETAISQMVFSFFILIYSSTTFWSLYVKREHTPAETSRRSYGSFSLNKAFVHLIKDCSFKLVPHTLSFLNPKLSIRVFLNAILIFHVRWNKLKIRKRKETHLAKLCTFHE